MAIGELFQSLPQGFTSIILVASLIAVLVIAYKIMEMVFETITVAALSGVFYGALTYIFSGGNLTGLELNELLLFVFLGASLYLLYSFALSLYSAGTTLIQIPLKMIEVILYPIKKLWKHEKEERKNRKKREKQKSTKEVVLDKTSEDGDEEDKEDEES